NYIVKYVDLRNIIQTTYGLLVQRENASLTSKRPLVRSQYSPYPIKPYISTCIGFFIFYNNYNLTRFDDTLMTLFKFRNKCSYIDKRKTIYFYLLVVYFIFNLHPTYYEFFDLLFLNIYNL